MFAKLINLFSKKVKCPNCGFQFVWRHEHEWKFIGKAKAQYWDAVKGSRYLAEIEVYECECGKYKRVYPRDFIVYSLPSQPLPKYIKHQLGLKSDGQEKK